MILGGGLSHARLKVLLPPVCYIILYNVIPGYYYTLVLGGRSKFPVLIFPNIYLKIRIYFKTFKLI